jgi:ABC-2 type transport system permease protein
MFSSSRYEWISIVRDRWVAVLFIIFFGITLFAVRNGFQKVQERREAIEKIKTTAEDVEKKYVHDMDSISRGLKPSPQPWLDPRALSVYGQRAGRIIAMDPQPLALMATGQSDLYTHTVKPKLYGEANALGFSELSNPVQLMFGSFDLAFVCIYLLPLLVLAFSYNLLSADQESGVLRLTVSQPISLYSWLFSKLLVRFAALALIISFSIVTSLLMFKTNLDTAVLKLLLLVLAYTFFWFVVAFLVNLFGASSGTNAIALVSIWVVLVLLVPSFISQSANTLYPIPSRINMIHEYRVAEAESDKKAGELLDGYLREHPELASKDSTQKNQYDFWLTYFASVEVIQASVKPVVSAYDLALEEQQKWVNQWRVLSPAILLQNSLNELAGTSTAHYQDFRKQVIAFSASWRNYFIPRMFNNENMKPEDVSTLPQHKYSTSQVSTSYGKDLAALLVFIVAALLGSLIAYKRFAASGQLGLS